MKSAKEIKLELERQEDLRKLKEFNELLEWIEMCITRQISSNQNGIRIFELDHNIGKYYYKIKPILEDKGYVVSKVEEIQYHSWIFENRETSNNYILIEWNL